MEMIESRKESMLSFYARPTIPFALECENPVKKSKILSEISITMGLMDSISAYDF